MRKRIIRILCCLACLLAGVQTLFAAKPWKLAVLSDVHLMSPQLLVEDGSAFQAYLDGDRKLLKESPEILDSITARVLKERPQVVFICGDLTKDGELVSHELLRNRYLSRFLKAGIKVYVVQRCKSKEVGT
ncbi:MAG: metallophosphoesterase [Prevotellaceae bacterium]|nr:metallophosphoesterase [Prevotellaceae bacterium]